MEKRKKRVECVDDALSSSLKDILDLPANVEDVKPPQSNQPKNRIFRKQSPFNAQYTCCRTWLNGVRTDRSLTENPIWIKLYGRANLRVQKWPDFWYF